MQSEWKEVKLEDVTSKIGDGLHGTPKYDENGEYYFINGNNLTNGKIEITSNTKRASYDVYMKHKKELNDRTIFVSINGTLGNVALYNGEKVFLGKSACYLNVIDDVDKQFVRYILTSNYFQHYISVYATGTTIKNMGLKSMRDFTFRLPALVIQKKIAHILSTLDDKIELNRKMNKTLEEMAQALFKSWFVDFDPVHAKADAKSDEALEDAAVELGLSKEVLELFPSEFEESEMGMIPRGWKVVRLEDVTSKIGDGLHGTPKYDENGEYFFINGNNLTNGKIEITDNTKRASYDEYVKHKKELNDKTIFISINGTLGNIALYNGEKVFLGKSACYLNVIDSVNKQFVRYMLASKYFQHYISVYATGTTIKNMGLKSMRNFIFRLPCIEIIAAFDKIVSPMVEKTIKNADEIETLIKTRDTLLPKLLSGELDVLEVEI